MYPKNVNEIVSWLPRRLLSLQSGDAVQPGRFMSGSPGESHSRAPTERSVTVSRHSALTIQSGGSGGSRPSARIGWVRGVSP